ncbi:MAG: DUF4097 family beta strand repeat-containing protein [Acholeplasmataceae bacterium]|jgi:hypothetical protein|nr:DUF4097 family beta strand repeat-containing protein [Acholeplasmataceae bacterium]
MKTFLNDLKNELIKHKVDMEEIVDIIHDHQEMIEQAISEGLSEDQIPLRFGQPKELARELAGQSKKENVKIERDGYTQWKDIQVEGETLKLNISLVSQDVIVQISEDDHIHIFYKGKDRIDDYRFSYEHGVLKLEAPKSVGFLFMRSRSDDMSFIIEIPEHLKVDEVKVNVVSSDLVFNAIDSDNFQLNTTSGDVNLTSATLGYVKLHTVSGDLKVSQCQVDTVETSQVSGDLSLEDVKIKNVLKVRTVSGDVDFESCEANEVELSAVSGDMRGKEFYPKTITFKSVSGDLDIKNEKQTEIHVVKKSTLSGEITIKS